MNSSSHPTVVTCYYKIPSKHSHNDYDGWIGNFVSNVNCHLIIFTSPDLVDYLTKKRVSKCSHYMEKTKIVSIEFENLELFQKYSAFWDYQYEIDQQKYSGRTKECYILWNSKLWFLKMAIELNPFSSDQFIWNDMGCLRANNPKIIQYIGEHYPNPEKISRNSIDITYLNPIVNRKQSIFIDEVHFSGAQFGGHIDPILRLFELFYRKLDEHISRGIFVGCDQQTFSAVYNENPELFNCIVVQKDKLWIDPWFYLWQYYT